MGVRRQGKRTLFFYGFLLVGAFFFPNLSHAADLNLTPSTGNVSVGKTISIQVMLDPSGASVNAADGTITFDKDKLSVSSVSKDGSAFSLWTADPSYSNSDGTISFSGGTPSAFSNSQKVLTIVFKGVTAGDAQISVTKGSVLAADGKGTDVYKNGGSATITVGGAAAPDTSTDTTDTSASSDTTDVGDETAPPIAPIIKSTTHPKPEGWYSTSTAVFTWTMPPDATGVRTLLSDKPDDTPKVALKDATTTQTVTGIKDGVSYFFVQVKNKAGWGDIGNVKIQVDTVPPESFSVALQEPGSDGGLPKLAFKTDDLLSGLDHYDVIIGTSSPITVAAQDITDGTYAIPPQGGGMQLVTIKAFDKAGNVQAASSTLNLPAVAKPKPASSAEDTTQQTSSNGLGLMGIIAIILLALIAGGFFAVNGNIRKATKRDKEKLLTAVLEVRDKNDRIFSAMREEFEQMVKNFDPQPQLTPQERALLEDIKEVLDISEELIDTGIEDIKKMIRNQQ